MSDFEPRKRLEHHGPIAGSGATTPLAILWQGKSFAVAGLSKHTFEITGNMLASHARPRHTQRQALRGDCIFVGESLEAVASGIGKAGWLRFVLSVPSPKADLGHRRPASSPACA